MPNFALKVIRLGFATVGRLFPETAGTLAFALFCRTPSRRPKGEKAVAAENEGRLRLADARRMPFPLGASSRKGDRVMAYRFDGQREAQAGPRYLVLHGWGSSAAYIAALPAGLAEAGAQVVVLDFPGHGLSGGRSLNMRQAVEAVVEAERRFGPFDAAVGHSFGGAALMLAAGGVLKGTGKVAIPKLATIGSPSEIHWLFDDFAHLVGLPAVVKAALVRRAEELAGARLDDFDTVAAAARHGRPVLIVHAEDDKEVAADHARRFESLETASLHWANGLGHRRIVSDTGVISTVAAFFAAPARLANPVAPARDRSGGDAAA